ncbi:MAG: hypothetical protein ACJ77B_06390 [Chloroflexota bacterium]
MRFAPRAAALIVVAVLVLPAPAAASPATAPIPGRAALPPTHHTSTGGVQVIAAPGHTVGDYGHFTNDPAVTVTIPPPTDTSSLVRVSNDGATWVEMPYAAGVPWSLTDPAGGGYPEDGARHVTVEYGDGTSWIPAGSDDVYLDRVPPVWTDFALENGAESVASWRPQPTGAPGDITGILGMRMSIDGAHWTEWEGDQIDLRSIDYGGSWALGPRTVYYQIRDGAGNLSEVYSDSINITEPALNPDEGKVPVRFEFPRPAITGSPFTVRPIYPSDFTMPSNAWCDWHLHWGDDDSLYGIPNEDFGEIIMERKASLGGCGEWTFTLPYNPGRRFDLTFSLLTKTAAQVGNWGSGTGLYSSPDWKVLAFTAQIGTTDRHIYHSTIPIVYVLPDGVLSHTGAPVTYRLNTSDGVAAPQTGQFWAYPMDCYINPQLSQQGGTTFTYTPACNGTWVTGWTGTYKGGYMRTQFDPLLDGTPPVVAAPVVKLSKAAVGTTAPITVSWSAHDKHSAMYQYQLQRSVNGGTWAAVTLPSRLTTTLKSSMSVTASTRYRVRGRDTAANWSGWKYGPTLRAATFQETYKYIQWTGAWTTASGSEWLGGTARSTTTPTGTSTFKFNGRSIAWIARTGPGQGLVRVFVDDALAGTVDLRSPTLGTRGVQFAKTWTTTALHSIRIENLGTNGSPGVDVDAFLLIR